MDSILSKDPYFMDPVVADENNNLHGRLVHFHDKCISMVRLKYILHHKLVAAVVTQQKSTNYVYLTFFYIICTHACNHYLQEPIY